MGVFDTIYSSYSFDNEFAKQPLQTKDLECIMCEYWINPNGELFLISYSGTQDFVSASHENKLPLINWKPNGNHGKITPVYPRTTIRTCSKNVEGKDLYIYFKYGIIQEYWTKEYSF